MLFQSHQLYKIIFFSLLGIWSQGSWGLISGFSLPKYGLASKSWSDTFTQISSYEAAAVHLRTSSGLALILIVRAYWWRLPLRNFIYSRTFSSLNFRLIKHNIIHLFSASCVSVRETILKKNIPSPAACEAASRLAGEIVVRSDVHYTVLATMFPDDQENLNCTFLTQILLKLSKPPYLLSIYI